QLALDYLRACGLTESHLILNSVGDAKCRPAYVETLRSALRAHKDRLCADCQRRTETNPLRVLDCKVPEDQAIIESLPKISDHLCADCRDHFAEVRRELGLLEIPYELSHRLVRGLDYYTRTTFEVTSAALGAQNSVLGGGRYDGLVKDLGGPDLTAIGFALGLERLVMLLPAAGPEPRCDAFLAVLAPGALDRALLAQQGLREAGVRVLMDHEGRGLKAQMKRADKLGARYVAIMGEYVLAVIGEVARRSADTVNPKIPTGAVEVLTREIRVLSEARTPPFPIEDEIATSEDIRLKYRYLDLRRPRMQRNIALRHRVTMEVRRYLDEQGFYEIETPFLTKSTPEGARDYLVPSRVHHGSFYALPQSPQIFKQILMVA